MNYRELTNMIYNEIIGDGSKSKEIIMLMYNKLNECGIRGSWSDKQEQIASIVAESSTKTEDINDKIDKLGFFLYYKKIDFIRKTTTVKQLKEIVKDVKFYYSHIEREGEYPELGTKFIWWDNLCFDLFDDCIYNSLFGLTIICKDIEYIIAHYDEINKKEVKEILYSNSQLGKYQLQNKGINFFRMYVKPIVLKNLRL